MVSTVIPSLARWGMSADADLVYRALVLLGPSDGHRLGRELGMDRPRIRSALDELAAAGAANVARGRLWQPRSPADVLQRVRRRPAGLPGPRDRWRRHFATLEGLGRLPSDDLAVRHWPTRALARRRAVQLVAAERHEHLAVNNEQAFSTEAMSAARPLDQSLLSRGIRVRVLERSPRDGDRGVRPRTVDALPGGAYRHVDEPPLKLMVFDRKVALFPADPLDLELGYVEATDPQFLTGLCALFERLWAPAHDPFRQGVDPIDLTSRESALVALLARGHTDQTAAEELGISPRTVAYAMRALMDRLGVENRFQLALMLGAAGAVPAVSWRRDDKKRQG